LTNLAVKLGNKFIFILLFAFTLVAEQVYRPFWAAAFQFLIRPG